jgi:hypothetical protein
MTVPIRIVKWKKYDAKKNFESAFVNNKGTQTIAAAAVDSISEELSSKLQSAVDIGMVDCYNFRSTSIVFAEKELAYG